jgi:HSP20 family protein
MAITRFTYRNPWQEMDQLTSRLGHLFTDELQVNGGSRWLPAVNVEETADELLLTAEIPGLSREDIDIEVEHNRLTIRGEKAAERSEGEDGRKYHVWERRYGSFARSFTLPNTVRAEDIAADYQNGVLTVRMPKAPEAKSRKIQVGEGAAQLSGQAR